mgnify:FL=1
MKSNVFNILKKEIREIFRDKKSLSMMLIIPIMIPVLILGMSALFQSQMSKSGDDYNKIGFAYDLSSEEETLVNDMNIEAVYGSEDELRSKLDSSDIYLYVTKEDNNYVLNTNVGSESGSYATSLMESYYANYKTLLQEEALTNIGQDANQILNIITLEVNDLGENNFYSMYIVGYAFLFIMMAITVSATYPATDTTAGEKERGTLETLLTFPIKSRDIIVGKLLGVTISSIITGVLSLVLALISFVIANNQFTIYETAPITISGLSIIMSVIVIIAYSIFISGLCIAIASMCKTFKEAQSALTPLTFVAFFPGMIAFMVGIKSTAILSIIPFLNFSLVFNDISNGIINYVDILLMFVSTIVYIAIIIYCIIKQYRSEKVLF